MVGVLDGHGGWQVSNYLSNALVPLAKAHSLFDADISNEKAVEVKMISLFQDLEDGYIQKVKEAYSLGFGGVSSVGSCVLIAMRKDSHLTCANLGDCRAVVGSLAADGKSTWNATTLTNDHNCRY